MPSNKTSEPGTRNSETRNSAKRPRQNPGLACQECRSRKLRCDRRDPCGGCVDAGVRCCFDPAQPARGPKKGYLKALQTRIATLERRLGDQTPSDQPEDNDAPMSNSSPPAANNDITSSNSVNGGSGSNSTSEPPSAGEFGGHVGFDNTCWDSTEILSSGNWEMTGPFTHPEAQAVDMAIPGIDVMTTLPGSEPGIIAIPTNTEDMVTADSLPPLTRADLDQLYFDRVHGFVPILQQSRYYRRSKQLPPPASHLCLQYAAWTVAATLSSHFNSLSHTLYCSTLERMTRLEYDAESFVPSSSSHTENIQGEAEASYLDRAQAWVLIALYESMQNTFQSAWKSAGRAIRLVQLMRLDRLDLPQAKASSNNGMGSTDSTMLSYMEEKRRTLWSAFCLDSFSCILGGLSLTLNHDLVRDYIFWGMILMFISDKLEAREEYDKLTGVQISTRLPCPEPAFQSGFSVQMPLLSEIMTANWGATNTQHSRSTPSTSFSPFAECVVLTSLWGRSLTHQQQAAVDYSHGRVTADFVDRQITLDELLSQGLLRLQQNYTPGSLGADPMLLFNAMIGQATILSLCEAAELMPPSTEGYANTLARYRDRATAAAKEIARLSNFILEHSLFKVHPFTPIPLYMCRKSLSCFQNLDASINDDLRSINAVLQALKVVNTLSVKELQT